jgi:hypothetical protein
MTSVLRWPWPNNDPIPLRHIFEVIQVHTGAIVVNLNEVIEKRLKFGGKRQENDFLVVKFLKLCRGELRPQYSSSLCPFRRPLGLKAGTALPVVFNHRLKFNGKQSPIGSGPFIVTLSDDGHYATLQILPDFGRIILPLCPFLFDVISHGAQPAVDYAPSAVSDLAFGNTRKNIGKIWAKRALAGPWPKHY